MTCELNSSKGIKNARCVVLFAGTAQSIENLRMLYFELCTQVVPQTTVVLVSIEMKKESPQL